MVLHPESGSRWLGGGRLGLVARCSIRLDRRLVDGLVAGCCLGIGGRLGLELDLGRSVRLGGRSVLQLDFGLGSRLGSACLDSGGLLGSWSILGDRDVVIALVSGSLAG